MSWGPEIDGRVQAGLFWEVWVTYRWNLESTQPPENWQFAPEKWCLETNPFLCCWVKTPILRGVLLSFRGSGEVSRSDLWCVCCVKTPWKPRSQETGEAEDPAAQLMEENAEPGHWKKSSYRTKISGWWFQICFFVHPYLGKWSNLMSIFFRWVETTN